MGRTIMSVVAGYLSILVFTFITFTVTYFVLGTDRVFTPGKYEVTPIWLGITISLSVAAAIVGGAFCASISRSMKGPTALIILIVVLGVLSAIPAFMPVPADQPTERAGDITMGEAMKFVRQPVWVAVIMPVIGAIGVAIGARMKKK